MADRPLKLRDLRRNLKKFDVWEDVSRGKGSHTMFLRRMEGGVFSYPVPTTRDPVLVCYVTGCRKRFKLQSKDGVSDDSFYA